MPTTYTNGLKLPDLGSIDWYNAYKNNIDILDPIVGTVNGVATTYAPISHNHDASEITSGTIDIARLPPAALERLTTVADQTARYALTTSTVQLGDTVKQLDTDIMYLVVDTTKLNSADGYVEYSAGTASKAIADEDGTSIKTGYGKLAGNNTWTGTNTYTGANAIRFNNTSYVSGTPSGNIFYSTVQWGGYVNNTWSAPFTINNAIRTNGYNDTSFRTYSQTSNTLTGFVHETNADASDIAFRPIANSTHKLGSSSYQWSSVYAQSYYYNGTEFQSKFVTTDTEQTITSTKTISRYNSRINLNNTNITKGVIPSSSTTSQYYFGDSTGAEIGRLMYRALSDGTRQLWIAINDNYANGALDSTGTTNKWNNLFINIEPTGYRVISFDTDDVVPDTNNAINLGTSTNKWKTLNGINPGALSLPDISGFVELDKTGWYLDGSATDIVASGDGWIQVVVKGDSTSYVALQVGYYSYPNCYYRATGNAINDSASAMIPVKSGQGVRMYLEGASVYIARFFPMLGNV